MDLREHYMQFHPEIETSSQNEKGKKKADKEKACNLCIKKFTSVTDLFNHQKYHLGRFHAVCTMPKCKKKFTTSKDGEPRAFVNANAWAECEGSVTFRNATQKQEHYMQFHPEIQTSSKNDKGMKKADKEKACNLCTKKFTSVTDLFNHHKYHRCRFHAMENQELFVNANSWAECEETRALYAIPPEIQTSSKNEKGTKKADKEKPCNLCTKKFTSITDLIKNQKYHRGQFHAVCTKPKCKKKFITEDRFMAAWTNACIHLGSTTSNRKFIIVTNKAESAHAELKRQLRSKLQHTEINASFEKSRCFIQHRFRHPELSELVGFVSIKALSVIVCESEMLEIDRVDDLSCGCAIRRTHQLPRAHEIAEYRDRGVPIPLDVAHTHCKKLDLINIGNSSHDTTSPGKSQLQRFNMWYEQQDDEKKRQKLKTKGRLRKVDTSTCRLPSAFEIAEASTAPPKNKPKHSLTTSLKIKPKMSITAVPKKRNMVASSSILSYPKKFKLYTPRENQSAFDTYMHIEKFPEGIRKYITDQTEVLPHGNCGYRAIATTMEFGHNEWRRVHLPPYHHIPSRDRLHKFHEF
ncbi:Myzus persicae-induced lipase 1 [Prunus dulcis]|uniref:Myzus persicae-induced lipase 1 n=1 Tax=Prunus dulcis TaxID=3755 RepID=A0A4Y1QXN6_PRUDU|nr:Myzus persicae-induced lipase 1 [Prunus dulcis]